MEELYRDRFVHIARRERNILHVVRSDERPDGLSEILRSMDQVVAVLRVEAPRARGILFDFRRAPARNDPAFEEATAEHRRVFRTELGRVAYLVKTAVGRLNMQRLSRSVASDTPVFLDEAEAIAHLAGASREAP